MKYLFKRLSFIGALQAAYILGNKPFGIMDVDGFNAISVQRAVFSIKTFLLSYNTEVIAGKSKGTVALIVGDCLFRDLEKQLVNKKLH
jgi:hypothetical protein